jgi:hypothetical protein
LKWSLGRKTKKRGGTENLKNQRSRGWGNKISAKNKTIHPKWKTNSSLMPAPTVESSPWRRRASLSRFSL